MLSCNKIIVMLILSIISELTYSATNINVDTNRNLAKDTLSQLGDKYSFRLVKKIELPNGELRYKFFQYYESLLVWNSSVVTVVPNIKDIKENELVSGNFYIDIEDEIESVIPQIGEKQAVHIATSHTSPNSGRVTSINVKLTVMVMDNKLNRARVVYRVDYFVDGDDPHRRHFTIDANSGEILDRWEVPLC